VPALARRIAGRLGGAWLPRVAWSVGRTGRAGLVGVGLLLAAAVCLVSTHLPVAAEVEALRADLARAQEPGRAAPDEVADVAAPARALPARTEMPAILRQLFGKSTQARLALDSGKYEISAPDRRHAVRAARRSGAHRRGAARRGLASIRSPRLVPADRLVPWGRTDTHSAVGDRRRG
jgi:hypothetical protein